MRGSRDPAERFALTLASALNTQARQGWEFLRAETLPYEERSGLTGTRSGFRTMLVFRRPTPTEDAEAIADTRRAIELLEDKSGEV